MFQHYQVTKRSEGIKQLLDTLLPLLSLSFGVCTAPDAGRMSEAEMCVWYAQNFVSANGLLHLFGFDQCLVLPPVDAANLREWRVLAANGFNVPSGMRKGSKRRKTR